MACRCHASKLWYHHWCIPTDDRHRARPIHTHTHTHTTHTVHIGSVDVLLLIFTSIVHCALLHTPLVVVSYLYFNITTTTKRQFFKPSPKQHQVYCSIYPLITATGLSLTHFAEIPAWWHVSTTSVTSLYDSGASSMTSLGEATRIEIPAAAKLSNTSW
jgi:hypothetical protein